MNLMAFLDNPTVTLPTLIKAEDRVKVPALALVSVGFFFVLGVTNTLGIPSFHSFTIFLAMMPALVSLMAVPFLGLTKKLLDAWYAPVVVCLLFFFPVALYMLVEKLFSGHKPVRKLGSYQLTLSILATMIDWGVLVLGVLLLTAGLMASLASLRS